MNAIALIALCAALIAAVVAAIVLTGPGAKSCIQSGGTYHYQTNECTGRKS